MGDASAPKTGQRLDRVQQRPGGRSARTRAQVLTAVYEELLEGGYHNLSHRTVARRAGVDPATVYRRWPTRSQLATDALLESARTAVSVPDTGSLPSDLTEFLTAVVAAIVNPGSKRLFQAFSAVGAEAEAGADGDIGSIVSQFWQTRFSGAKVMFHRAVQRGEVPADVDAHPAVETLVSPIYFRLLVSGERVDPEFVPRCVRTVLLMVGYRGVS